MAVVVNCSLAFVVALTFALQQSSLAVADEDAREGAAPLQSSTGRRHS